MRFAKIHSAQANILGATKIDIEADVSNGLNSIVIVGLPDKAVHESLDRVSSAIKNSGFTSPKQKNQKVVISLAPADLRKTGTNFDVPIAIAYLEASKEVRVDTRERLFVGELSLDGKLRPVKGVLPIIIFAKENNFKEVFVPIENIREASLISGINIFGAENLIDIVKHISKGGGPKIKKCLPSNFKNACEDFTDSSGGFDDIRGNEFAKRALLIAASGGHNISLFGPPGTGKTMLARSFTEILPPLEKEQQIESSSIHSLEKHLDSLITTPPIRAPHHTSSHSSIIGGGNILRAGEITLAHNGVLFLDEFPEFDRRTIESLRQPLEDKEITISRASGTVKFPASFILIASMNPCPCGYFKTGIKKCDCTPNSIQNYKRKMSGPIMDRIDIWIRVSKVDHDKLLLSNAPQKITRDGIRQNVKMAREIQKNRANKLNNLLTTKEINKFCEIDDQTKKILNLSAKKMALSPRSYYKILKVARTIADIESSEKIKEPHILEALQYRKDNFYF